MKKRRQYTKFPGPVAAVAFNCDGTKIAVRVSYTWDEGEKGLQSNPVAPWLGVRLVGEEFKVRLFVYFTPPHPFLVPSSSYFMCQHHQRRDFLSSFHF